MWACIRECAQVTAGVHHAWSCPGARQVGLCDRGRASVHIGGAIAGVRCVHERAYYAEV